MIRLLLGKGVGYQICEVTDMSEKKIENEPLERKIFYIFGTLREIFPKILVDFPQIDPY